MTKVKRFWGGIALSLAVLALLLTTAAPRASADSTTITLTNSNLGSGYTGPFATVLIDCSSTTTCTVTFTAAGGYQIIDNQAADLNINGSFSAGSFTVSQLPTFNYNDPSTWTYSSTGSVDGFGDFNFQLQTQDGSGSAINSLSFVLTATGGNSWANAASVLTLNNDGYTAAAHVATCSGSPCTISNTGAFTGYAANVPEPGSLTLFGTGLLSLAALLRRRMNRSRT